MKTKVTCRRCGGGGNYSFNLRDGTMCYGCNGSGFQMVDLVKESARKQRAAIKQTEQLARQQAVIQMTERVFAEFNPIYGPFDISTELGRDQLNCAVARALGKNIYRIRDERLNHEPTTT